jgi:hypothetical protein
MQGELCAAYPLVPAQDAALGGGKGETSMFFKAIALLMTAIVAYFVICNDFDYEKAIIFVLLPASTILSYLLLGTAD